jgi:N4-gp56 family major capsid protein
MYDFSTPDGGGRTISVPTFSAPTIPTANNTDELTKSSPTLSAVTLASSQYAKITGVTDFAQQTGACDVIGALVKQYVALCAETHDDRMINVLQGASASYVCQVGQTDIAALTNSNVLTTAYVRKAYAILQAAKAPMFRLPGMAPGYVCFIHPHVVCDLRGEAAGSTSVNSIVLGQSNVNSPSFQGGYLGFAEGFHFVPCNAATMVEADAGSGTCDAYNTLFVADMSVGRITSPIVNTNPAITQIGVDGNWACLRIIPQNTHAGLHTDVASIVRVGFARMQESGIYRVESGSSFSA